jgi:hypothetical protein
MSRHLCTGDFVTNTVAFEDIAGTLLWQVFAGNRRWRFVKYAFGKVQRSGGARVHSLPSNSLKSQRPKQTEVRRQHLRLYRIAINFGPTIVIRTYTCSTTLHFSQDSSAPSWLEMESLRSPAGFESRSVNRSFHYNNRGN